MMMGRGRAFGLATVVTLFFRVHATWGYDIPVDGFRLYCDGTPAWVFQNVREGDAYLPVTCKTVTLTAYRGKEESAQSVKYAIVADPSRLSADLDGDGDVDGADIGIAAKQFGK
jgi:hypothetical protein